MKLEAERLRELLHYDPETGVFTWRVHRGFKAQPGKIAGKVDKRGYRLITVDCKSYWAHRLAWLYMTGAWPKDGVDHRDLVKDNNSWGNLRQATASQNQANRRCRCDSRSGLKGVTWHPQSGKWRAYIRHDGRFHHLGLFDAPETAHAAYLAAAEKQHGEFARGVS